MKKFLTILSVGTLALSLISCDKFFGVKSESAADAAAVFTDYTLSEYAIFGIHESFGMVNCYRGRYLPWYGHQSLRKSRQIVRSFRCCYSGPEHDRTVSCRGLRYIEASRT